MNYFVHVGVLISIFSILGVSLNLLAGYTGLPSLAHAAFYGIGAYATALLSIRAEWSWVATVPVGALLSAVTAYLVGKVALRFRDDYFVIATFALQVLIFSLMLNWTGLTKGPMGLPGIRRPILLGWVVDQNWEYLLLTSTLALLCLALVTRLTRSPYGLVLRAIREDEVFAAAMGKPVAYYKTSSFVIGALLASLAGSLYAGYVTFIDPFSFTVQESIFVLAIVIIGGAGHPLGPIMGAFLLIGVAEGLRFLGLPPAIAANTRQILYGILLIVCAAWRPGGIFDENSFWGGHLRRPGQV